jgi:hypothetical protein
MDSLEERSHTFAGLSVSELPTEKLVTMGAPYNPRRITDEELLRLRKSLRRFGLVDPVIVNRRSDRIVGGHQRVVAAAAEGIEAMPVAYVDLDEIEERSLNLSLNKISGEWDEILLADLLLELEKMGADLADTGFSDADLDAAMGWQPDEVDAPGSLGGSTGEFMEMTFVLSEAQAEVVKEALAKAKRAGLGAANLGNENTNGCALHGIVATYLHDD